MRKNGPALAAGCAAAALAWPHPARAHVVAGARVFPVTLTFDDPGVSDEASIPAFAYSRTGVEDGVGPTHAYDFGFEYDKTITPDTALILNDGYDVLRPDHAETEAGFENLYVTGKWQFFTDAAREFVASLGVIREIGGSGTDHTGADRTGSTAPTGYFGKGLGDLPIGWLRPLAVTGKLSFTIADREAKTIASPPPQSGPGTGPGAQTGSAIAAQFTVGTGNAWAGALSIQYSLPYLESQVRDIGLPSVFGRMIPIVELTWTSPADKTSAGSTTWNAAPGVIWLGSWGEIGAEALIPLGRAAGTTVGAVALVHVFLDDLLPDSLGRPLIR